jgi:excinuclease UvrABC nuclease subunit
MNISGDLHEFTQRNVSEAPIGKGVYSLHKAGEMIYIGKAEGEGGIRERLQAHMRGEEGHCTQQATGYRYELARRPTEKAEELLLEYRYAHGQLPLCNDDLVDI